MPNWVWPVLGFAVVALVFAKYFKHVASGKPDPYAMVDWGLVVVLVLVVAAAWSHFHDAKPWTNPLTQLDVCSKTGQVGGPPITSPPCGPGHAQPVIDARHNDPLPRPMSAQLPGWMSNEMAQDRYNQCIDAGNGPTECVHAEALYQCLKAGGTMDSCG